MTTEFTIIQGEGEGEGVEEDDLSVIRNATKIMEFASSIADDPVETAMALSLAFILFAKTDSEKNSLCEILHAVALAYKYCEARNISS